MRKLVVWGALVAALLWNVAVSAEANSLKQHESPYLRLHANDPVAWQALTSETLKQAQDSGKPILISSGYFSCHWCHVMQEESFQNASMAEEINRYFIPVKMDRELDYVTDRYLNGFTESLIGVSGWPLTVIVTPEGFPLAGTTYLPPLEFRSWYLRFQRAWASQSEALKAAARKASQAQQSSLLKKTTQANVDQLAGDFLAQAMAASDELQGGFGHQAKFPSSPQLLALLRLYDIVPQAELKPQLMLTLDQMMRLGLRDYLGGGFFRYTTDPDWRTPHFEKMLYDNAQLAQVYLKAADTFDHGGYYGVATHTLSFLQQDMSDAQGAFIAALSAVDDQGREGAAYLWTEEQLKASLPMSSLPLVRRAWGMDGAASFEYGYLPMELFDYRQLAKDSQRSETEITEIIGQAWMALVERRKQRVIPRDDKVLSGWNGLTLSALTLAARYGDPLAQRQAPILAQRLLSGLSKDDRVPALLGASSQPADLAASVFVLRGLMDYALWAEDTDYFASVEAIAAGVMEDFYSSAGWRLGDSVLPAAQQRILHQLDGELPSATGMMFDVITDLARLTGKSRWSEWAATLASRVSDDLSANAFFHATTIMALAKYERWKLSQS